MSQRTSRRRPRTTTTEPSWGYCLVYWWVWGHSGEPHHVLPRKAVREELTRTQDGGPSHPQALCRHKTPVHESYRMSKAILLAQHIWKVGYSHHKCHLSGGSGTSHSFFSLITLSCHGNVFQWMSYYCKFTVCYFFFNFSYFMCTSVPSICMYVHHVCVLYPLRSEDHVRSPGTGITGSCKMPHGCWELNPGPLQEHKVLLITQARTNP